MIYATEKDIGRRVIYQGGHPDDREEGVISSINSHGTVFVRFGRGVNGQGCDPSTLTWSHPHPTERNSP